VPAYGAYVEASKIDNRSLYVIGPDGKIAYKTQPFRVLAADAYTELADIVDKLSPPPTSEK
jgi:peroxiredoxin